MKITEEGAMRLLEAMCKESADVFEGGVRRYIEANKDLKKAKKQLEEALNKCAMAMDIKRNAIRDIRDEYGFLNGENMIQPMFDGSYVMSRLIIGVVEDMSEADLTELLTELNKEED